jgi:hypothetical protein
MYCTAYFNRILVINTTGPLALCFYETKENLIAPFATLSLLNLFSQFIFQVQGRNYISVTFFVY